MKQKYNILFSVLLCLMITSFIYAQDNLGTARQHYKLGEIYYKAGLYKEAEKEFRKALELAEQEDEIPVLTEAEPLVYKEPQAKQEELVIPAKSEVVIDEARRTKDYIIDQGDVLYISVWENPDLSQEVIVRPDGKISFSLIDEVEAQGRTILELDKEITKRLKEYIRFPDVSISLKKMAGSKVVILGQVKSPGVYNLTGRRTILEAVSLAGGLTPDSIASSVVVIKGTLGDPKAQRVNLNEAIHNTSSKQNIVLASEDVIFVPKKFIADLNYFLKQVLDPISRGMYTAKTIRTWGQE